MIQKGRDEFYKGETAKKLAQFLQEKGGYITEEDLASYEAKWRTPISFSTKTYELFQCHLPVVVE